MFLEDWQKSNRKGGVDGMSQKSVDAYKRENPGSKLQTAVTERTQLEVEQNVVLHSVPDQRDRKYAQY